MMSNSMTAVLPRGNYSRNEYPSFGYKLRNRNALQYTSEKTVIIKELGNSLCFRVPLKIKYVIDEGLYAADINVGGLIIASAEDSLESMTDDIKSQFRHAWSYYALESDDNLNDGAKDVKEWLINKMRMK